MQEEGLKISIKEKVRYHGQMIRTSIENEQHCGSKSSRNESGVKG